MIIPSVSFLVYYGALHLCDDVFNASTNIIGTLSLCFKPIRFFIAKINIQLEYKLK